MLEKYLGREPLSSTANRQEEVISIGQDCKKLGIKNEPKSVQNAPKRCVKAPNLKILATLATSAMKMGTKVKNAPKYHPNAPNWSIPLKSGHSGSRGHCGADGAGALKSTWPALETGQLCASERTEVSERRKREREREKGRLAQKERESLALNRGASFPRANLPSLSQLPSPHLLHFSLSLSLSLSLALSLSLSLSCNLLSVFSAFFLRKRV